MPCNRACLPWLPRRQKYKVIRKVKEHHRKKRKEENKVRSRSRQAARLGCCPLACVVVARVD